MKCFGKSVNRMLSVLFAVTMLLTSMPQTGLSAMAQEAAADALPVSEETLADTADVFALGGTEAGNDDPGNMLYYSFTLKDEHVHVYDMEDRVIDKLTVSRDETVDFKIVPDEGYVVGSVQVTYQDPSKPRASFSKAARAVFAGTNYTDGAVYTLSYSALKGAERDIRDYTITINAVPLQDHTLTFDYNADEVALKVYRADSPKAAKTEVVLVDSKVTVSSADYVTFTAVGKEGYLVSKVYERDNEDYKEELTGEPDENDPKLTEYSYGRAFSDVYTVEIVSGEACTVNWSALEPVEGLLRFYPVTRRIEDGETVYEQNSEVKYSGTMKVRKGEPLYFSVEVYSDDIWLDNYSYYVTTTGDETGKLTAIRAFEMKVYCITPTEEMTITGVVLPVTIPLVYDDEVTIENAAFAQEIETAALRPVVADDKKSLSYYMFDTAAFTFSGKAGQSYTPYYLDSEGIHMLESVTGSGVFTVDINDYNNLREIGIRTGSVSSETVTVTFPVYTDGVNIYYVLDEGATEVSAWEYASVPKGSQISFRVELEEHYELRNVQARNHSGYIDLVRKTEGDITWYSFTADSDIEIQATTEYIDPFMYYEFRQEENVSVVDLEGNTIETIRVEKGETAYFKVVPEDGYTVGRVALSQKGVGELKFSEGNFREGAIYSLTANGKYNSDLPVQINVGPGRPLADHELTLDYRENDITLKMFKSAGPGAEKTEVIPVNNKITFSSADYITFRITGKNGNGVGEVKVLSSDGQEYDVLTGEFDENNENVIEYVYTDGGRLFHDGCKLKIVTGEACTVHWQVVEPVSGFWHFYPARLCEEEDWFWYESDWDKPYTGSISVVKGEPLYFTRGIYNDAEDIWLDMYSAYVTTTGDESGKLNPVYSGEDEYYYCVVPEGDMTITGVLGPKEIPLVYDDEVTIDSLAFSGNIRQEALRPALAEDKKSANFYYENQITITFSGVEGQIYTPYTTDSEGMYLMDPVTVKDGKASFSFDVYSYTKTIGIKTGRVSGESVDINFNTHEAAEVYFVLDEVTAEARYWDDLSVPKGTQVRFRLEPDKGYLIAAVSARDNSGNPIELIKTQEGEIIWYSFTADKDIAVDVTMQWDVPEARYKNVVVTYDGLALETLSLSDDCIEDIEAASKEDPDGNQIYQVTYRIPEGKWVYLHAWANDKYVIKKVTSGDNVIYDSENAYTDQYFSRELQVSGDMDIRIETAGEWNVVLTKASNNSELSVQYDDQDKAAFYKINKGDAYIAKLYSGDRLAQISENGITATGIKTTPIEGGVLFETEEGIAEGGKVSLVLAGKVTVLKESTGNASASMKVKLPSVYPTKLTVTKKNTTIYTNQKEVLLAALSYDAAATVKEVTVKDTTNGGGLTFGTKGDELYASAYSWTTLGKHTIEITPVGPEGMYQKPVVYTVTVVKGIEDLRLSVPSDRFCQAEGKTVSIKTSVFYNEYSTAPKTKKVRWSIVDADGKEAAGALKENVTINAKNGTVTVGKDFAQNADQKFRIKAVADDYEGNTVSALTNVITISAAPVEDLGELVIVKYTSDESGSGYKVFARDGARVTAEDMGWGSSMLLTLKKDVKLEDTKFYTMDELAALTIPASDLTAKSSAPKSIAINKWDAIYVNWGEKVGDNVKLTVTTADGSKKSASMKISLVYGEPEELALTIYGPDWIALNDPAKDVFTTVGNQSTLNAPVSFRGTTNTVLSLDLCGKTGSNWSSMSGLVNHTVKVSGGKIVNFNPSNGSYSVLVTGQKATVTLTDKAKSIVKIYTIENTAYSADKAPKIAIKKNTNAKLTAGDQNNTPVDGKGRTLTYTVDQACDYVWVEADAATMIKLETSSNNPYWDLINASDQVHHEDTFAITDAVRVAKSGSENTFTLKFNNDYIAAGSYKLVVTPLKIENGVLKAASKPVNVTVKAENPKAKKGSFSVTASYTLSKAAPAVELKTKSSELKSVEYTLMCGNAGGVENNFLRYFELKSERDPETRKEIYKICLREDLTDADIAHLKSSKGKNDLKGYLRYTASYGDDGYGRPTAEVTKAVQISIKMK